MDKTTERETARGLGLKKYNDGTFCRHGHQTFRYTINGCCVECAGKEPLVYLDAHVWDYYFQEHKTTNRTRLEAAQKGETTYFTGKACRKGHKLVRTVARGCVGCDNWREVDGVLISSKEHRKARASEIVGKQYGDWTVLDWVDGLFICKCKCGTIAKREKHALLAYSSCVPCARLQSRTTYTGKTYGKVKIISERRWKNGAKCVGVCDCGFTKEWFSTELQRMSRTYKGRCQHHSIDAGNISAAEYLYKTYKRNAEKRGYSFTITSEEFCELVVKNCHYSGHPPMGTITYGGETLKYNGVDRQDNSRGYEPDNCVTACKVCNISKGTRTLEDFLAWLDRLREV